MFDFLSPHDLFRITVIRFQLISVIKPLMNSLEFQLKTNKQTLYTQHQFSPELYCYIVSNKHWSHP